MPAHVVSGCSMACRPFGIAVAVMGQERDGLRLVSRRPCSAR